MVPRRFPTACGPPCPSPGPHKLLSQSAGLPDLDFVGTSVLGTGTIPLSPVLQGPPETPSSVPLTWGPGLHTTQGWLRSPHPPGDCPQTPKSTQALHLLTYKTRRVGPFGPWWPYPRPRSQVSQSPHSGLTCHPADQLLPACPGPSRAYSESPCPWSRCSPREARTIGPSV